jgi:hypothetical protein
MADAVRPEDLVPLRSRDAFAAAFPHFFAVRLTSAQAPTGPGAMFKTQLVGAIAASAKAEGWSHVYPLLKTANNPYAGRISIGRTKTNDIVIEHPAVSKLHCILQEKDGTLTVLDPGSRNGVKVNGVAVAQSATAPVKSGDLLGLGALGLLILNAAELHDFLKRNPTRSE